MIKLRSLLAIGLLSALAACSSPNLRAGSGLGFGPILLNTAKGVLSDRRKGPRQQVVVTPELLASTKVAALQVNPEILGGSDFLQRIRTRTDRNAGKVEIWKSTDNAQVFMREGVVVGSRGVGGDIISSDAAVTVRATRTNTAQRGVRSYTISDGDVTSTKMQFQCEVRPLGSETIVVVQRELSTNRLRETCTGGPGGERVIQNDYWVQKSNGLIRKSRQWMGPRIGYFEFILLKN